MPYNRQYTTIHAQLCCSDNFLICTVATCRPSHDSREMRGTRGADRSPCLGHAHALRSMQPVQLGFGVSSVVTGNVSSVRAALEELPCRKHLSLCASILSAQSGGANVAHPMRTARHAA